MSLFWRGETYCHFFHVAGVWMIASYEFLVFRISTDGLSFLFRYDWDSHMVYGGLGDLLLRRRLLRPRRSDFPFTFRTYCMGLSRPRSEGILTNDHFSLPVRGLPGLWSLAPDMDTTTQLAVYHILQVCTTCTTYRMKKEREKKKRSSGHESCCVCIP